jgi:hypothetical protein
MTIILDPYTLPEKGPVEIRVNRTFHIKVTAEDARRQVNRWLHNEVSYMMRALPPTLVIGQKIVWRVPASIGFPHTGQVGTIGTVEVDVETGEMDNTPERKAAIERCAEALATRVPPFKPRSTTPTEYLAKNVPPAPKLILPKAHCQNFTIT